MGCSKLHLIMREKNSEVDKCEQERVEAINDSEVGFI